MSASSKKDSPEWEEVCPLPHGDHSRILLAHGGGGRLTRQLTETLFGPAFKCAESETNHDGAVLDVSSNRWVMTTDSYVVQPLFFPGGDIGTLAVHGTVNDLAMCGARPRYLSAGFILEEGLSLETLRRVVDSMKRAANEAGVSIVTGDTKVVARGSGDGIFINTTGVGEVHPGLRVHPDQIEPGDALILSGDLARHGIAVLAAREGFEFQDTVQSDCANVYPRIRPLIEAGIRVHCLRDLTRGGLATALNEITKTAAGFSLVVEESAIVIQEPVKGACELLGLDPLYVANEGCFVAFVASEDSARALEILQDSPEGKNSRFIGKVEESHEGEVILKTTVGSSRILDLLSGDLLPRIC